LAELVLGIKPGSAIRVRTNARVFVDLVATVAALPDKRHSPADDEEDDANNQSEGYGDKATDQADGLHEGAFADEFGLLHFARERRLCRWGRAQHGSRFTAPRPLSQVLWLPLKGLQRRVSAGAGLVGALRSAFGKHFVSVNRYSAGHEKLRLGVFLLPVFPLGILAARTQYTTYLIGPGEVFGLFALAISVHLGLVVIHEVGHVVAGWLFRMPIRGITIGHWRRLVSFRIGATQIDLRAIPDVGYVVLAPRAEHVRLWPQTAFALGGVLLEGAVVVAIWSIRAPDEIGSFHDAVIVFFRLTTVVFGIWHVLFNLAPRTGVIGGARLDTDGKQLLDLWRRRRSLPQLRALAEQWAPIREHFAQRNFSAARDALLTLTQLHPENLGLAEALAQAHALSGDTVAAESVFRRLLAKYDGDKLRKAELLDWLICIALFRDRPDLLTEAQQWMAQALSCAPDALTLQGTKGAFEVTLGNYDEAIRLLLPLFKRAELPDDQAYMAAALAEAYAGKGDLVEGQRWLQIAIAAAPDNLGVRRARAVLSRVIPAAESES